jgi:hypothetical protein
VDRRPAVVQTAKTFEMRRHNAPIEHLFPQAFPQELRIAARAAQASDQKIISDAYA